MKKKNYDENDLNEEEEVEEEEEEEEEEVEEEVEEEEKEEIEKKKIQKKKKNLYNKAAGSVYLFVCSSSTFSKPALLIAVRSTPLYSAYFQQYSQNVRHVEASGRENRAKSPFCLYSA